MESSYAACADLAFGRMSFKGANPEIEKLMRKLQKKPTSTVDPVLQVEKDADVSAMEAVGSLGTTISRKFAKTRHRGFKRPAEEPLE